MIKIASCQYQIENLLDWQCYVAKIESLISEAKQQGVQLILLPEYAGVEVACARYETDRNLFKTLQAKVPQYIEFYSDLARRHHMYIQPGTMIVEIAPGRYVNRAYFFGPEGEQGYQDKLQLTEYEKKLRVMQYGEQKKLFKASWGDVGIAICYDSEFPEIVRFLVDAGALLILVPSYTTSMAGYNRVLLSCRARAIENQCYVAVSYVVNTVNLSAGVENTFGQAAILSPVDKGFPDDGIIAQGKMNEVSMIVADIYLEKLLTVREQGEVRNFADRKRC